MTFLDRAVKFLLPRETGFFDLLERGAACARESGAAILSLCDAKTAEDRDARLKALRDIEHAADEVIHQVYDKLSSTFVTPIERSDIYTLATDLEEVVDRNHATAMQLLVHAIDDVPQGSREIAALIADATIEIQAAVLLLRDVRRLDSVAGHTQKMSQLETQGDTIFRTRVGALFKGETNAIRLIQHKEFLEGLEDTLDACDHVGTTLKSIVIKNA